MDNDLQNNITEVASVLKIFVYTGGRALFLSWFEPVIIVQGNILCKL